MEQSARQKFYERIEAAPLAVRGFFESVENHFEKLNDVDVRFTHTNVADMRLWALWGASNGKQRQQIFAALTWQPRIQAIYARTKLTPNEFKPLGYSNAEKIVNQPQNSKIKLFEENWRYGALPFIRALEAAKMKLSS